VISHEYSWDISVTPAVWKLQGETRRIYDGMDVVQERDAQNNVTVNYTRSGNIGGLLARSMPQAHLPSRHENARTRLFEEPCCCSRAPVEHLLRCCPASRGGRSSTDFPNKGATHSRCTASAFRLSHRSPGAAACLA
jgi:hypothetical protein